MNTQVFDAEFLNFAEDVAAKWETYVSGQKFPIELFSQDKNYRFTIQGELMRGWNGGFRASNETGRIEVAYEYLKSNEAYTGNFIFYQMAWGRAVFVLKSESAADEAATKLYCSLHKPVKEMIRGIAEAYGAFPERNKARIEKIIELLGQIMKPKTEWTKFADQFPVATKKIQARHITTPDIIGEPHYFEPGRNEANIYEFEWRYEEAASTK